MFLMRHPVVVSFPANFQDIFALMAGTAMFRRLFEGSKIAAVFLVKRQPLRRRECLLVMDELRA